MSGERDPPENVAIETASSDDRLDILRVLDAAMLETDTETVDAAIDAGDALVARFERTGAVVGALVATRPEPDRVHVDAVAVRRTRRGRGIGSTLVAEAVRRAERDAEVAVVTAVFDADLRAFYADVGFAIRPTRRAGESRDTDVTGAPGEDHVIGVPGEDHVTERNSDRLWGRIAVGRATSS